MSAVSELNRKLTVIEREVTINGISYFYISNMDGYILINVYNRDYDFNAVSITNINKQQNAYVCMLAGNASGKMRIREIWLKL